MVVRLVLEHDQPLFALAVDIDVGRHAAGVDFRGELHVAQEPFFMQFPHGQQGQVHQAYVLAARGRHAVAGFQVALVSPAQRIVPSARSDVHAGDGR
jgi:hypothetical protein